MVVSWACERARQVTRCMQVVEGCAIALAGSTFNNAGMSACGGKQLLIVAGFLWHRPVMSSSPVQVRAQGTQ
jgi:hypothetical protein